MRGNPRYPAAVEAPHRGGALWPTAQVHTAELNEDSTRSSGNMRRIAIPPTSDGGPLSPLGRESLRRRNPLLDSAKARTCCGSPASTGSPISTSSLQRRFPLVHYLSPSDYDRLYPSLIHANNRCGSQYRPNHPAAGAGDPPQRSSIRRSGTDRYIPLFVIVNFFFCNS